MAKGGGRPSAGARRKRHVLGQTHHRRRALGEEACDAEERGDDRGERDQPDDRLRRAGVGAGRHVRTSWRGAGSGSVRAVQQRPSAPAPPRTPGPGASGCTRAYLPQAHLLLALRRALVELAALLRSRRAAPG